MAKFSPARAGLLSALAFASLTGLAAAQSVPPAAPAQPQRTAPTAQQATPPAAAPSSVAARTWSTPERIEARVQDLHQRLGIRPEQESKWKAVADAMRENGKNMEAAMDKRRDAWAKMSAIEDLKSYQQMSEAHSDALKNMIDAFTPLYDSMSPDQRHAADEVFHRYNQAAAASGAERPAGTPKATN
ncbi:MAG: Spy/CpxP family protein refolding chaperone [Alphaproteobacteria bacterium]|nr:Spy/CpxP family protein refolding chaperone [Alphaproteobacteria bacterium]